MKNNQSPQKIYQNPQAGRNQENIEGKKHKHNFSNLKKYKF
jgi:hypothetical protein